MNTAMELPTELLWSVSEVLRAHNNFEARFIEAIAGGKNRPPRDLVDHFLKKYGLRQYRAGPILAEKANEFISIAHKYFCNAPKDLTAADIVWNKAVDDFAKATKGFKFPKSKNKLSETKMNNGIRLHSAFLKLFWFYHPESLTMWDTKAAKGLPIVEKELFQSEPHKSVSYCDYLERFKNVYDKMQPHIDEAVKQFIPVYPYKYRVLDKYLWLKGLDNGKRNWATNNYKASLRLLPVGRQ